MIRIVMQSSKFYGLDIGDEISDDEMENIKIFTREGTPVIIVEDIQDLTSLDIDPEDVIMVK